MGSLEGMSVLSGSEQIRYEVMEAHRSRNGAPTGMLWMAVDALADHRLRDRRDAQAVRRAVEQCIPFDEQRLREPFARLGWFQELGHWIQEEIAPRGLRLNGSFRQLNASPTFCLIRFETDGSPIWFKAAGVPNRQEFRITVALTRLFSRFLPEIIATRPEWNGWLALEAPGKLLCDCPMISRWASAARDLAELQIHSLSLKRELLDSGARDLRGAALADLVEPYFETMADVMEQQTKTPPLQLSHSQLRLLGVRVGNALDVLEEAGISEALGHMDLNPGNIVCSPDGSVFLDWAEAYLGHPFLTFEYLREHFRKTFREGDLRTAPLLDHYIAVWRATVSDRSLRRSLEVTPLLAVFACAGKSDAWSDPEKVREPQTAAYLRSLTRRMERETRALAERSVSCPN